MDNRIFGYARVSSADQNLDRQLDALVGAAATVQKVADGAMRAAAPMVDDALAAILLMRPMVRQVLLRISVTPSTIGHTSNSSKGTGL